MCIRDRLNTEKLLPGEFGRHNEAYPIIWVEHMGALYQKMSSEINIKPRNIVFFPKIMKVPGRHYNYFHKKKALKISVVLNPSI